MAHITRLILVIGIAGSLLAYKAKQDASFVTTPLVPEASHVLPLPAELNGSRCDAGFECNSGYCLNNVCTATKPNGSQCDAGFACDSGYCLNNKCTATKPNGAHCLATFACTSGYCLNNKCTATKP